MAQHDPEALARQLDQAFAAFRSTLEQMLQDEAQRSVEEAVTRLQGAGGPIRVDGVDVQVVVRDLKLVAGSDVPEPTGAPRATATGGRQRARRAATRKPRRGGVREALLAVVEESGSQVDMDGLRTALAARGVSASTANLHQQLRRLTQNGEIERVGRGMYQKPKPKSERKPKRAA